MTSQFLIEHAQENEQLDRRNLPAGAAKRTGTARKITFYCHTQDCLRKYILAYFGEHHTGFLGGNRYNCRDHFERTDITVDVQIILSCVKRTGERFGLSTIVDVLRGAKNEKIFRLGLDKQSTYGLLRQTPEPHLRASVRCLIEKRYLNVSDGDYPVLSLGEDSRQVLLERAGLARMKKETPKEPDSKPKEMAAANPELFQKLRALRGELARKQSVPAYVVFTDASLQEMCRSLPKTEGDFLRIPGVGQKKWEKYGEAFLQVIQEYQTDD